MMKNRMTLISLIVLTGCESASTLPTLSSLSATSNEDPQNSIQSVNTVTMAQKYLYVMADGGIKAIPIDSTTGELIETVTGNWWMKPLTGTGNFYTMVMNPNGKILYALLRNTSLQSKIYQYNITDVAYSTYSTGRPLVESTTKAATNVVPGLFSWGNNGNLFIQNFNYNPNRVDSYTINATTSLLSSPVTVGSQTTASVTYGLSFVRVTEVGYDNHTYAIDSQTNRILHYVDGVLQGSFDASVQSALTDIALH